MTGDSAFGARRVKLPATYFVARRTSLERVSLRDADELRLLRTELELLRRINQLADEWRGVRGIGSAVTATPECFAREDIDELESILQDASHPIIEVMATQLDAEFRGI